MSDRFRTILVLGMSAVALIVMFSGLTDDADGRQDGASATEDRVAHLASAIKCPFCNGESLADSQAGVAADYRALIAERVADGATDDEIIDEFASRFGDAYILTTSTSAWSVALWAVPTIALFAGAWVLVYLKRSADTRGNAGGQTGGQTGGRRR